MKNRLRERARRVGIKKERHFYPKSDIGRRSGAHIVHNNVCTYNLCFFIILYIIYNRYYSNNIITGPARVIVVLVRADDVSQFSPARSLFLNKQCLNVYKSRYLCIYYAHKDTVDILHRLRFSIKTLPTMHAIVDALIPMTFTVPERVTDDCPLYFSHLYTCIYYYMPL